MSLIAFVVIVVLLVGLARDGLRLQGQVHRLRVDVAQSRATLSTQDVTDAQVRTTVSTLQRDSASLLSTTGSLSWRVGSRTPLLGGTLTTIRSLARAADDTSRHVLPVLTGVAVDLRSSPRTGPLDVRAISARRPELEAALRLLSATRQRLASDDRSDPTVRRAHAEVTDRLDQLGRSLAAVTAVARVGPAMTGEQGTRHYLVLLQSPSESRATGGLVGGFLELAVDRGAVTVVRSGTNHDLKPGRTRVPVTGGFAQLWGSVGGQQEWFAANLSLDLPTVSTIWTGLYRQQYGVALDGVLAVTPEGVGHLLHATGPLRLPDGTKLTSRGAAKALEVSLYERFPANSDEPARNAYQVAVLHGLSAAFLQPRPLGVAYVDALRDGARDGSFRLASTHPQEQSEIAHFVIAGALPRDGSPFVAWSTQNAAGTKLDVYVHRSLSYRTTPAGKGRETAVATVDLRNDAPTSGLPPYVVDRADGTAQQRASFVKGSEKLAVATYLTRGARVTAVTVDGRAVHYVTGVEQGYPVVVLDVVLQPGGGTSSVVVTAEQPAVAGPVATVRQPVANPDEISLG